MSKKYHVGGIYGKNTIVKELEPFEYKNYTVRKLLIRCDCGKEEELSVSGLRRRISKKKGCSECNKKLFKDPRWVNLAGRRNGKILVTDEYYKSKSKNYYWKCKCDCGKEKYIFAGSIASGRTKSCGCDLKKPGELNNQWSGYKELSGTKWGTIRRNAEKRNLNFEISIKDAYDLLLSQNNLCKLSGIEISLKDGTASLDRIDSSRGYTIDNLQWTHIIINKMKSDLNQDDFIKMCNLISEDLK